MIMVVDLEVRDAMLWRRRRARPIPAVSARVREDTVKTGVVIAELRAAIDRHELAYAPLEQLVPMVEEYINSLASRQSGE